MDCGAGTQSTQTEKGLKVQRGPGLVGKAMRANGRL